MTEQVVPTQVVAPETPKPTAAPEEEDVFDKDRAKALIDKLRGEIKDLKPRAKKADDAEAQEKARKEAEQSELEKVQKHAADLEAKLKQLEIAKARSDVAHKVGLPEVFADRIKGETPEEMEADAKLILDALPKGPKPPPAISPTNPGGAVPGETVAQQTARIHGHANSMWDPEAARKHGGGVFAPEPKP